MFPNNPQILVVGGDSSLLGEFQSALAGVRNLRALVHHAPDLRLGLEAARSRRPHLLCVEMERDLSRLRAFAQELMATTPEAYLVGVLPQDLARLDGSENAFLIEALRVGFRDFLRRPISTAEFREVFLRLVIPNASEKKLGRLITFVSNKGGVGKSTFALNTAVGLAKRHPDRVLLVDCSLQLGVCASMLNLNPRTGIVDAVRQRERLDPTLLHQLAVAHPESSLRLLSAPLDAVAATEVDEDSLTRILNLARRSYDYVVVDTFPVVDGLVVAVLDLADAVYVVVQTTVPNIAGSLRFIQVLDSLGVAAERQRVILNQNFPDFPGNLRRGDIERQLGRTADYSFQYKRRILAALNSGRPYALHLSRWRGFDRSMRALIADAEGAVANNGAKPIEAGDHGFAAAPAVNATSGKEVLA